MENTSPVVSDAQSCIDACTQCHRLCLQTALNHCLELGGKHIDSEHYRLMMNCAELCQTSANFQIGSSQFSAHLCRVCAEICNACAKSCQQIGGMENCVQACLKCAASCEQMASSM